MFGMVFHEKTLVFSVHVCYNVDIKFSVGRTFVYELCR